LSLLRPNIFSASLSSDNKRWATLFHAKDPHGQLGALTVERGLDPDSPFVSFSPKPEAGPGNVCVFSAETKDAFKFSGPPTPAWQRAFAKKFAKLAASHDTKLVFLHLNPVYSSNETNNPYIQERECWPEVLGTNVVMMGIPPAKLFSGLSAADLSKLFYTPDHYHFNENGERFFTPVITPTLIQIYESQTAH
jgi:hypothetical protein